MKPADRKVFRCAIYTRKSTEHNLDLAFNSLDAQREACEAYIKSQSHEGWRLIPDHYDDGGMSGASLDRPAVQSLLADVSVGKINIVVVYKVDRLTRSLADFAKLVELFDRHGVSFVSVTQSFNTTSSMGRLTLNVLLSFAQFEREVIGERVRDKIAASKRKGIWVGGPVPLGYRCIGKKLVVVPEEAETVRTIFRRYLELGSLGALTADLDRCGIRTKAVVRLDGSVRRGIRFGVGVLAHLLKNRFYLGKVVYRGEVHQGEHEPIIDRDLFEAVQARLAANGAARTLRLRGAAALLQNQKDEAGSVPRVPAPEIEQLVVDGIRAHLSPSELLADVTECDLIERHVERVIIAPTAVEVRLMAGDASAADNADETAPGEITLTLAWTAPCFAAVKGIQAPCELESARSEKLNALHPSHTAAEG